MFENSGKIDSREFSFLFLFKNRLLSPQISQSVLVIKTGFYFRMILRKIEEEKIYCAKFDILWGCQLKTLEKMLLLKEKTLITFTFWIRNCCEKI